MDSPFWVCLPMSLSNGVSSFEPRWKCWDNDKKDLLDVIKYYRNDLTNKLILPGWTIWATYSAISVCIW